jgi:glycosyltransferase involved in cell wall biosynthesis
LAERGHRVLIGCIGGSTAAQRCREMGLRAIEGFQFRRGFRPLSFWRDCRLLSACCAAERVDVIHAHLSQETWVACVGARLCRPRPVLIRSRGVVVPVRPHVFNRLLHNRFSEHVVVPSRVIYEHLLSLPGFDRRKVSLLPEGVDLSRFSPHADGSTVRAQFNVPPGAPFVVMVARLERVKGHEIFFRALAKLLRERTVPGLRALCACDERAPGAYERTVGQARELGCPGEVLAFTGMRDDIEKVIAAANCMALPSLGSEGSSRVALEAAASGVPLVASSVGCLPEVVQDGATGLLVPPGDPDALAGALARLLNDAARAKQMGQAARRRAEALFDEKVMAERLEQIYLSEAEVKSKK